MYELPDLSFGQYQLVYNAFSFVIACMIASFVFFTLGRSQVAPKYRISLLVSALVVGIAGYHYFRIFESWSHAYELTAVGDTMKYVATGTPFNDAYRYVDWLLTVPLLMVELVLVLGLAKSKQNSLLWRLTVAAFLMILLGYPGEGLREDTSMFSERGLWGLLSTIPFVYILYVLWTELGQAVDQKSNPKLAILLRNIRLLTLATWGFYPIAYMAPFFGLSGAGAEVFLQLGYSIADVAAKCGYGLMIYAMARVKTEAEGGLEATTAQAGAPATA